MVGARGVAEELQVVDRGVVVGLGLWFCGLVGPKLPCRGWRGGWVGEVGGGEVW